ncbi:hypothetical protein [Streptomyces acidicola]|uniref:hypothetical protein n=1 Tax=Streptomyces acidicola TaxID=2596892 RepID=UPI0037FE31C7
MPTPVPLHELVRVAGRRWSVEESTPTSKALAGLDEHQVGLWHSWKRWVTLAMLAHAFLTVTAARERIQHVTPDELTPITCHDIQRLFTTQIRQPNPGLGRRLRWTLWRRRHQARARTSHHRRQATQRA